ncbi:ECF-type sigma factor [Nonomuraea sp. NPDC050153]|uniref:ECF-type sigma factor n=1 Tax=Nonomuraea sp. NPDC050153 TaxID=3364359 RepID=UPI00378C541C
MPETDCTDKATLTPEPARRVVENDQYAAFLRRAIRAYGRRIASGDVEALADAIALIDELDDAIAQAVTGLRAQGYSWTEIARPLTITRQAAQQRWGGETA